MSVDVLAIELSRWQRFKTMRSIAKPFDATHGIRMTWKHTHYALLAKARTPNVIGLLMQKQQQAPGILLAPLPESDRILMIVWTEEQIQVWRCVQRLALISTIQIVNLSLRMDILYGFCASGFKHEELKTLLPETRWEVIDFDWQSIESLPALASFSKRTLASFASLLFSSLMFVWLWPDRGPLADAIDSNSLATEQDAVLSVHEHSAAHILNAHNEILRNLMELPGWSPARIRWHTDGILVYVRADTGDLRDLHEFSREQGIQIQRQQDGRVLVWKRQFLTSSSNQPSLPFQAQGDWLEDLIVREFPSVSLTRRDQQTEQARFRGRFYLRFQDFSLEDFETLFALLTSHALFMVSFEYEVMRQHSFPWLARGEFVFEYVGD